MGEGTGPALLNNVGDADMQKVSMRTVASMTRGWSPVESGRAVRKDKLLTDLALQPVLSQANGFGQSQLSVVEGPKSLRLQFQSNGNV